MSVHRRTRAHAIAALLAIVALASAASGVAVAAPAESRTVRVAKQYLQQHGLQARYVESGPSHCRVRRMIVPVLRNTADDFAQRFSKDNGFVRLRDGHRDKGTFLFLSLEPGRVYHHHTNERSSEAHLHQAPTTHSSYRAQSRLANATPQNLQYFQTNKGISVPIDVKGSALTHLSRWLAGARNNPTVRSQWSNCMHYTTNAEVKDGVSIAKHIGIKRSSDGPNLMAKVLHASNAKVEVIARYVDSQAEFNQLAEKDLLGPKPMGGVGGAVHHE